VTEPLLSVRSLAFTQYSGCERVLNISTENKTTNTQESFQSFSNNSRTTNYCI